MALSVPAGAAIAFSDDSNPATFSTQPNNMNTPDDMPDDMNGMDGNDMMGGMPIPPADITAPRVNSIVGTRGTGANENTITWVVTFSERVTGILPAHFVLSPAGGTIGTVATNTGTGTTITITTTHDENSDGMVTLMFDASAGSSQVQDLAMNNAAADITSSAVDIDLTPAGTMDFLTALPTTITQPSSISGSSGSIRRLDDIGAHTGGTTRVQIGGTSGTTYTFASHQSADGFLLDNSNGLLIASEQGTSASASLLFFGTNIGQANSAFTDIATSSNSNLPRTSTRPNTTVSYTGRYLIARLPTGTAAYDSQLYRGDVTATVNFSANSNAFSGTTTPDDTSHMAGTISGGSISVANNIVSYGQAFWIGRLGSDTSNTTMPFGGSFFGTGGTVFSGEGLSTNTPRAVISLYGEPSQ